MNLSPLVIVLKSSRILTGILIVAHALSGLLIVILPLPIWLKLLSITIVLGAAFHYTRHYALLRTRAAVRELRLLSDGRLEILRTEWQSAEIVGEQFIHPMLTIIRCKTEANRWPIAIVILSDMLDAEPFRMLRVRLKWQS